MAEGLARTEDPLAPSTPAAVRAGGASRVPTQEQRDWVSKFCGIDASPAFADGDAPDEGRQPGSDKANGGPPSSPIQDQPTPGDPNQAACNADLPVPRPILPDCRPLRNQVDGPKNHVMCKMHGHIYDEDTGQIIANSFADYQARHRVPRPMEADCKPAKGKLPNAPKHIMLCEKHGHVVDTEQKQIIANTAIMYLRDHPEHGDHKKPPSAPEQIPDTTSDKEIGTCTIYRSGKDYPGSGGRFFTQAGITVRVHQTGDWQFELVAVLPKQTQAWTVNVSVALSDPNGTVAESEMPRTVHPDRNLAAPGEFSAEGGGKIKNLTAGAWRVSATAIVADTGQKIFDGSGKFDVTPGPANP